MLPDLTASCHQADFLAMLQRHVAILLVASALAGFGLGALAADVPDTLEQRLLACAACHGKMGEGTTKNETYPRLAGKTGRLSLQSVAEFQRTAAPVRRHESYGGLPFASLPAGNRAVLRETARTLCTSRYWCIERR